MTGRSMGRCNSNQTPMSYGGYGRGMAYRRGRGGGFGPGGGRRRGFGMGFGWTGPADPGAAAANEVDVLKNEADFMKKSLEAINRRITELQDKPSE